MRNKRGLNNVLSTDRKTLYMVLSIVMVSVLMLTVVYAALSTTLQINGQAEVSSANWDIHLDNVVLNSSSATTVAPTITDSRTANFTTTLTKPGDFYEFTIDVVNDGSIDAMIDSVTKIPELSVNQKKYLNYIVEYQNGKAITTKQLVAKDSFVRLKVKLEFRKDITASDLPTTSETLNLAFTVNYVQSDGFADAVDNNGQIEKYKIGDEICFEEECFNVISIDNNLTLFSKMNITTDSIPKQDSNAPKLAFSTSNYWYTGSSLKPEYGTTYPAYVYDSNAKSYVTIENYKLYLEGLGANIIEARLISLEELLMIGCSMKSYNCSDAPEWVYATRFWTGSASGSSNLWRVYNNGAISNNAYTYPSDYGIRPVITILKQ